MEVSALVSGSSGLGSSPDRGHCVVFLGKTLYSHSASLHPGVYMGTGELLGKPNKLRGVTCDGLASRPGGVEILIAASCYGNWDKLRPDRPVWLQGFTFFFWSGEQNSIEKMEWYTSGEREKDRRIAASSKSGVVESVRLDEWMIMAQEPTYHRFMGFASRLRYVRRINLKTELKSTVRSTVHTNLSQKLSFS